MGAAYVVTKTEMTATLTTLSNLNVDVKLSMIPTFQLDATFNANSEGTNSSIDALELDVDWATIKLDAPGDVTVKGCIEVAATVALFGVTYVPDTSNNKLLPSTITLIDEESDVLALGDESGIAAAVVVKATFCAVCSSLGGEASCVLDKIPQGRMWKAIALPNLFYGFTMPPLPSVLGFFPSLADLPNLPDFPQDFDLANFPDIPRCHNCIEDIPGIELPKFPMLPGLPDLELYGFAPPSLSLSHTKLISVLLFLSNNEVSRAAF